MAYNSFRVENRKLETIYQQFQRNHRRLENNNNFKPLDVQEIITNTLKGVLTIEVLNEEQSIWYGSIPFVNCTKEALEHIYPVATFVFRNKGMSTRDVDIFDGSFNYWYHQVSQNLFVFRFAVDANLDPNQPISEGYGLNLKFIIYNNNVYDNIQKSRK